MDLSENQAISELSVDFTQVEQIWFYVAYVDITDFPEFEEFEGVAVEINWVVDQIHYEADAEPPTVTTAAPTSISTTSANLGGNVTDDGGAQVTERGVVYSTSPDPTTADNVVQIGDGTGSFSENVTGLDPGTTYFVRAYATNSEDTRYGSEQSFTTQVDVVTIDGLDPPQSTTNADEVVFQVLLSGPVSGLSTANFSLATMDLSGTSILEVSGSGDTYEVSVDTGSGDGSIRLDLDNTVGVSPGIVQIPFTDGDTYTIDRTPPQVTLLSSVEATGDPVVPISVEFSQAVSGFEASDIVVDNGSADAGSFSDQGGGTFTVDIIPANTTAGQLYDITISIPEGVAEDAAGNASEASEEDLVITFDSIPLEVETTAADVNEFDGVGYTNQSPIPVTIAFSKPVFGFELSDIEIDNATLSDFSGADGDSVYSVNVDPPPGDGPSAIALDIAAGATEDDAGNPNEAAETLALVFDQVPPTPVVSTTASSDTNVSPIPVEIDFGETVLGFSESIAEGAISAANGTGFSIEDFEADSEDEVFSFNLVPDADDTFTIELASDLVSDLAGNDNEASNALEVTLNTSQPQITFLAVEEGGSINSDELESPINDDFFTLFIDFGEQLDSFGLGNITADNALVDDLQTVDFSGGVYSIRIEPQSDGEVTITIPEGEVQDLAGNDNEEGQFQITVDRTAPTIVSIQRADGVDDPTNQSPFDIVITFSQEISDFDVSELSVTNGLATDFSTADNITFTVEITPDDVTTQSISLEIGVPAGAFTDLAGNENEPDSEDFTIEFGDTRPTAFLASQEPDPTNADFFFLNLDVYEIFQQPVSSIDVSDFTVTGAIITNINSNSNPFFELYVEPQEEGEISIQLNENVLTDAAGNLNEASNEFTIVYDVTAPEVVISSDESGATNAEEFVVTFSFDQPVFGFEQNDIVAGNAQLSGFSGGDGDTEYSVTVSPEEEGLVTIDVPEGVAQDAAGNDNAPADPFSVIFDTSSPTVSVSSTESSPTNVDPIPVTIEFSEDVTGFEAGDIVVGGGSVAGFSGSGSSYSVDIAPDGDGEITVDVPADVAEDEAGNGNEAGDQFSIDFVGTAPSVTISSSESSPTNTDPIPVTIEFSEEVTGFEVGDIVVSGGSASDFSGSGSSYSVEITPDEDGTITVDVPADVAEDEAGNGNEAADQFTITYDSESPVPSFHAVEDGGAFDDDPIDSPTNDDFFTLYISFSQPVIDFAEGMLEESNALLSAFTEVDASEGRYSVRVQAVDDGEISVFIAEGVVQDEAGNDNQEGGFTIESDRTAPEIVALEADIEPVPINDGFTNVATFELQLEFSEPIVDFDVSALIVENASFALLDDENQQQFTLEVTADSVTDSSHTISVEVPEGAFTDEAGNALGNSESFAIEFGDTRPTAQFTTSVTDTDDQEPIPVTLTFTEIFGEAVSGFDVADIVTENVAGIELVSDANPVFELEVTPDGFGPMEVSLSLPEGAVTDIAGNENEASDEFTISGSPGIEPVPVPVAGPFGLMMLALLTLIVGALRRRDRSAVCR